MNHIFPSSPYLLTVAEAARLLGAKPWPVMQLCKSGHLPQGRIGERIVIPARAVREYAERIERGELKR